MRLAPPIGPDLKPPDEISRNDTVQIEEDTTTAPTTTEDSWTASQFASEFTNTNDTMKLPKTIPPTGSLRLKELFDSIHLPNNNISKTNNEDIGGLQNEVLSLTSDPTPARTTAISSTSAVSCSG